LTGASERAEQKNEVKDRKVQRELNRREKGKGKLTNEQLSEWQRLAIEQLFRTYSGGVDFVA
jgi:hypothetical protein